MIADVQEELPEGWRVVRLSQLCELRSAGTPPSVLQEAEPGAVPLVRPGDLREHRIVHSSAAFVSGPRAEGQDRGRVRAGDILVTRTGTVGRVALVTEAETGWFHNSHTLCVRPSDEVVAPYLAGFLAGPGAMAWMNSHAAGSAIRSITVGALAGLPVVLPPLAEQRRIGAVLGALDEKIRVHEEIARTTALLRDSLAGLLMSGRQPAGPE
ncbi:restriction endonuclease subunit S [Streptomyces sp. NPDC059166]|uniref:restriction endonuclease subunit S n=1 Tax=Streptomyces sp. NPDC059166 TaxID=3346752 RepID=UPI0036C583F3